MRLEISCQDRLGITQDVLDILVSHEVDLRGIEINEMGKIYLSFPNMDFEDFKHLMPKIRKIEGIDDVKTIPFMPLEREQNQLRALLQTLPDPVFSVDTKGRILLVNDAVTTSLESEREALIGVEIDELVKGFNTLRWLESKQRSNITQKVRFIEQTHPSWCGFHSEVRAASRPTAYGISPSIFRQLYVDSSVEQNHEKSGSGSKAYGRA